MTGEVEMYDEWEEVPSDPDPVTDLGYDPLDLDVMEASAESDYLLILPTDEEQLRSDAYMVATPDSVCALNEWI